VLTPLMTPNLYAWYSIVSKFTPELRQGWPQMKATAAQATTKPDQDEGNKRGSKAAAKAAGKPAEGN